MKSAFNYSKLKTFKIEDLAGRTLKVERFICDHEGIEMVNAFDCETGDVFLLAVNHLPQISQA